MAKLNHLSCFKAYDIQGEINVEINEQIAFLIGYATAEELKAKKVVVGYDLGRVLLSSQIQLLKAFKRMALTYCVLVWLEQRGVSSSCELWRRRRVVITASHNPINYNGMKIVKSGSQPLPVLTLRP